MQKLEERSPLPDVQQFEARSPKDMRDPIPRPYPWKQLGLPPPKEKAKKKKKKQSGSSRERVHQERSLSGNMQEIQARSPFPDEDRLEARSLFDIDFAKVKSKLKSGRSSYIGGKGSKLHRSNAIHKAKNFLENHGSKFGELKAAVASPKT